MASCDGFGGEANQRLDDYWALDVSGGERSSGVDQWFKYKYGSVQRSVKQDISSTSALIITSIQHSIHYQTLKTLHIPLINTKMAVSKPDTCCGSGSSCVCGKSHTALYMTITSDCPSPVAIRHLTNHFPAQQATCSCGQKSALHCTCDKASAENALEGPRCSCRARPAGECTCDRASTENSSIAGSTCACGSRPAGSCAESLIPEDG